MGEAKKREIQDERRGDQERGIKETDLRWILFEKRLELRCALAAWIEPCKEVKVRFQGCPVIGCGFLRFSSAFSRLKSTTGTLRAYAGVTYIGKAECHEVQDSPGCSTQLGSKVLYERSIHETQLPSWR